MHIITGEIRKEPRIKQTDRGTLYIVELSERFKNREGNAEYTNYTFFFSDGGKPGLAGWYAEAFQQGKVISVSCETLKIESREYEGKVYNTLQAGGFANLVFSQRGESNAPQGSTGGAPRQQAPQQRPPQQQPSPQQQFDDDIPF